MSGSHTITAGNVVGTGLQTLRRELQAHEAELHLTARTDDVLAARLVMLHLLTAGGTGPDGGTVVDPLHFSKSGGPAGPEQFKVMVDAAIIATAVRARSWTFPRLQTLPAELKFFLVICFAHQAPHTEVSRVLPFYKGLTTRTLSEKINILKL